MEDLTAPQKPPIPNDQPGVWDLVIADMKARDDFGRKKYGVPVQPFNGRDALVDAYQEVLDLAVYLRLEIEERRLREERRLKEEGPKPGIAYPPGEKINPHVLKCVLEPFEALWIGEKTHEVRKFDRDFKRGDWLRIEECRVHPDRYEYTGRVIEATITYLTNPGMFGLADNDVGVLSVCVINRFEEPTRVVRRDTTKA